MKSAIAALLVGIISNAQAAAPAVSNVRASQHPGTKKVDIYYDISDADGDLQTIAVQISADGGLTYNIPCVTLTGAVGAGVSVGTNKFIQWNAGVDWNGQFVASTKVRVTAYDGTTPPPPPGMAFIPAGPFQMGDSFNEVGAVALPVHNVQVDAFFIDKFEVTREIYENVRGWGAGNGYSINPGSSVATSHPLQNVTWYDAVKWCNARSEKEGFAPVYFTDAAQTVVYRTGNVDLSNAMVKWTASGYRLPTEAEWEKGARGGLLGMRYPWGNTIDGNQANYNVSGDPFDTSGNGTTPVGYYNGSQVPAGIDMANGYGLYDMAGNVYSWCWDWFDNTYYGSLTANNNPHGPATGTYRALRGGAYNNESTDLRCAKRTSGISPNSVSNQFSFRCAKGL